VCHYWTAFSKMGCHAKVRLKAQTLHCNEKLDRKKIQILSFSKRSFSVNDIMVVSMDDTINTILTAYYIENGIFLCFSRISFYCYLISFEPSRRVVPSIPSIYAQQSLLCILLHKMFSAKNIKHKFLPFLITILIIFCW
jgi:hypothetical protein